MAGRSEYLNGTFTLSGSGGGNLFSNDSFHFAYQPLTGDGVIVARVVSLYNTPSTFGGTTAYGGLMIRESLTDSSTVFNVRLNSSTGVELLTRISTSAGANLYTGPVLKAPYWLKIARQGSSFSAF